MRWALTIAAAAMTVTLASTPADARKTHVTKKHKAVRTRGFNLSTPRRESSTGRCPCNGGPVCVGPRGGRYCITTGENKRYGV